MVNTKNDSMDERKLEFMNKVAVHLAIYEKEMLRDFFDYWTESNEGGRKMRFEMQKVFDIKRRLRTWYKNNNRFNGNRKSGIAKVVQQQQNLNALVESKYGNQAS